VLVANDVNLGMLGEARRGAAKGAREAVGIFVGTGIGGGVLLGGRIWEGHGSRAGEIGHMRIARDGPKCGCGGVGCLEAIASRTAVERAIRQAIEAGRPTVVTEVMADRSGKIRSGVIQRAARQGDEVVVEALTHAAEALGIGCVNVINFLDPEIIVIGGGLIEACGGYILPTVAEVVERGVMPGARPPCPIVPAALGDDAVVHGAAIFAEERLAT
jgi:glucokinase